MIGEMIDMITNEEKEIAILEYKKSKLSVFDKQMMDNIIELHNKQDMLEYELETAQQQCSHPLIMRKYENFGTGSDPYSDMEE